MRAAPAAGKFVSEPAVNLQEPEEETLVRRAQEGDLDAFEDLTNRYEKRVYSVAYRILRDAHEAEDVAQETFMSALEGLPRFRRESSFGSWLLRIATHAALKALRKRRRLDAAPLDCEEEDCIELDRLPLPETVAVWQRSPEELAQNREAMRLIEKALAELDDKRRIVFVLRDMEGLSVRETADILGISEGNVKVRLLRARLELRERLTKWFGDPRRKISLKNHRHGSSGAAGAN